MSRCRAAIATIRAAAGGALDVMRDPELWIVTLGVLAILLLFAAGMLWTYG